MKKDAPASPFDFSTLDLIRKTFQFAWANGGVLLWWFLPVIATQLVIVWQDNIFSGQSGTPNASSTWALGFIFLQSWFSMVSQLRAMRFTLLGERPDTYFVFELFRLRTWRYMWRYFLMGIQILVVGGLAAVVPIALVQIVLTRNSSFSDPLQFGWALGMQIGFVFLLGASLLVKRFMLFAPNVAIDAKASLAELGKRAEPVRWALFRAFFLLNILPIAAIGLIMTVWAFSPDLRLVCNMLTVVSQVITPLINLIQVVAYSLIYMHLRPLLEREEPESETLADPADAQP